MGQCADATLATLPDVNYIYYGDNVYSVDSTGTLDALPTSPLPTGTVTNGTVDLTYVRKVFGNLEFRIKEYKLCFNRSFTNQFHGFSIKSRW